MGSALEIRGLTVTFGDRTVIDGLELAADRGESLAIMGRSGCGKSTLLNCIAGLVKADAGTITAVGVDVTRLSRSQSADYRSRHVGIVFQDGELLPELTAVENVAVPGLLSGMSSSEATAKATTLLHQLDVLGLETEARNLSGGERARVAVARALICEPEILLADEPTGSLDAELREETQRILYSLPKRYGCVLLVVTHDPAVAKDATRRLKMTDGILVDE